MTDLFVPPPEPGRAARLHRLVGRNGLVTLALAVIVAVLTLGLAPALAYARVLATARGTGTEPGRVRLILVLGQQLKAGRITPDYQDRLDRALALARRHAQVSITVLGGRTSLAACSEAEMGAHHLLSMGVAPERITLEDGSRHTLENLRNYRRLFGQPDQPVILVTSRYHLARAGLMATGLGIPHRLCAAEPIWQGGRHGHAQIAREAWLVHWYLVGHAYAHLARNRSMLAEIS